MVKLTDIINAMEKIAPCSLALEYDNVGLLVGSTDCNINKVLFTLDITEQVADEAIALGADLIICHHPLIFKPIKQITVEYTTGKLLIKLIRHGIAVFAAHTNWDAAEGGVNDTLAMILGLQNIKKQNDSAYSNLSKLNNFHGIARIGLLKEPMSLEAFAKSCDKRLNAKSQICGQNAKIVQKVAVCGGSIDYDDIISIAAASADVILTGDIKYFEAQMALDLGLCIVAAGHYQTESPSMEVLMSRLDTELTDLHLTAEMVKSKICTDPFSD